MEEQYSDEIDLGALASTLWRAKWFILAMFILCAGGAYYYATRVANKEYSASASVAIEEQQSSIAGFESLVSGVSSEQSSLNTEIEIIKSRQLLERLVIQENLLSDPEFNTDLSEISPYSVAGIKQMIFGAEPIPERTEDELIARAIDRIRTRLSVSNPRQTYVFQIGFRSDNAQKSAHIANVIADLYINDQLLIKEAQAQDAIEFLGTRTSELQTELSQAELAVKDFVATTELVTPETIAVKNRQLAELRDRVAALNTEYSNSVAALAELDRLDAETAPSELLAVSLVPEIANAAEMLASNRLSRAGFVDIFNTTQRRLNVEVSQNEARKSSLESAVTDLEQEIDQQSRDLLTLQQLEREAEATRELYGYFLTRLKEAEVQQGTQQSDARLLSKAVPPNAPSSPRISMMAALGGVLGIVLASAIAMLNEYRQNGIRTVEELTRVSGQKVLGQVPVAPVRSRRKLIDYIAGRDNSAFSEAIRNLRTSLLLSNPNKPPKTILITSSVPGEGKTTISISLANNLAGLGKKVILIETDVRRRTFNEYFKTNDDVNLVSAVNDGKSLDDSLRHEKLNISILMGGKPDMNAADFFSSQKFIDFLDRVSKQFDYVILDAPPVLAVPDARIVGQHVDSLLYVCAWDDTPKGPVKHGVHSLTSVNLDIAGVTLSKFDPTKMKKYGSSGNEGGYYWDYSGGYYDSN